MQLINDLGARVANFRDRIKAATDRVVDSGWVVLGPEVKRFEADFAAYVGATHCVGVANGTEAIAIALRAVGIGRGDRVATVANAGMYSVTAMAPIGAEPVFMDVDPHTQVVTLAAVEAAIEQGAKAVIVTHLFGRAAPDIEAIARTCSARGVKLVEDCAQAHGARVGGRQVGSFGDAASFSFYPTKNLGAMGDGGAVVTSDDATATTMRLLRQYGWTDKYRVEVADAVNSRLDEMQAAILSEFLPELDAMNARRRDVAARYAARIRPGKVELPDHEGEGYVAHLYVVRCDRRDDLRAHLRDKGILSDVHYPIPDHRQPVAGDRYAQLSLPHTEALAGTILTLPCYPEMSDDAVDAVADAINAWNP